MLHLQLHLLHLLLHHLHLLLHRLELPGRLLSWLGVRWILSLRQGRLL